ncbi:hypothetical protein PR048_020501 [Dryococelus australis]|uniref:Integrase catalytic domain-containing protein n=1 Tax=Dryococelus australis TaxID=614101 RepID=A0ABQ9H6I2_9NEOP|nr:hypothetical protein PR048_020501 [Dryococelus australis]
MLRSGAYCATPALRGRDQGLYYKVTSRKNNVGALFIGSAVDILVIPLPNQEAETVTEALIEHVFSRFGVPLEIHSNQERNFEAAAFQEVTTILGMKKARTTASHPQSGGMVERLNCTLEQYLSIFVADNQND